MCISTLQLMRRMLRHTLILLRQRSWQQQDIVSFASTMHSAAIDGLNDHIPDGLRFHIIDIYLDELNSVGEGKVFFCFPIIFSHMKWYKRVPNCFCMKILAGLFKVPTGYCVL